VASAGSMTANQWSSQLLCRLHLWNGHVAHLIKRMWIFAILHVWPELAGFETEIQVFSYEVGLGYLYPQRMNGNMLL